MCRPAGAYYRPAYACEGTFSCTLLFALLASAVLVPIIAPLLALVFSLISVALHILACFVFFHGAASLARYVSTALQKEESAKRACSKRCAFAKMASSFAKKTTTGVHSGISCDRSGESPIVGMRYHLQGHNWDLFQREFDKCAPAEKALYTAIPPPVSRPSPDHVETVKEHEATLTARDELKRKTAAAGPSSPEETTHEQPTERRDLSGVTRIQKTADQVRITFAVPGVKASDLDVNVLGNTITIQGETTRGGATFYVHRQVRLPPHEDLDVAAAHATYTHGELVIVLKRKAGKRIPVVLATDPEGAKAEQAFTTKGQSAAVKEARTGGHAPTFNDEEIPEAMTETQAASILEGMDVEVNTAQAEAAASSSDEWEPLANEAAE